MEVTGYREYINGEEILLIDDLLLVRSSGGKKWYAVEGDKCGCEAGEHGKECHHIRNLGGYIKRANAEGKGR